MTVPVRELTRLDRPALERHFLALDSADRRLRFGMALPDRALLGYVSRIEFGDDAVFGVSNDDLEIVGVAHLAIRQGGAMPPQPDFGALEGSEQGDHGGPLLRAELGLSVLPACRGLGVGGALFRRAHLYARNHGVLELYMHCLTENAAVMHIARKQGMVVVTESAETEAWLKLPRADLASQLGLAFEQGAGTFDYEIRRQLAGARRIGEAFAKGQAPHGKASGKPSAPHGDAPGSEVVN
jgi:GNAT superfamily N-acetyltransferase